MSSRIAKGIALAAASGLVAIGIASSGWAAGGNLVAAYALDEGSGTLVHDSSGNGNDGTISNATWTAGKFGGALAFDGSSSRVTVPDSASLHLSSAMTLEAWVDPAVLSKRWSDVIYKGNDNYDLSGSSRPNGRPGGGGMIGGTDTGVYGAALPASRWTHLAVTYDGTTLRLYVNGVQSSSRAKTGSMATSTSPLTLGSDPLYGQFFQGAIDDVRIYNTALAVAQIQTDMNTPVAGSPPDTTPPAAPTSLRESAATTSSISAAWTASSDNVGVLGYRVLVDGAVAGTTATTSYTVNGLACGSSHLVAVDAYDAAGNHSQPASATMVDSNCPPPADTQPPTAPGTLSATPVGSNEVDLSWVSASDNVGVAGYQVFRCQGAACSSFSLLQATGTGTTFNDLGLGASTSYTYEVRAVDAAGNLGPYSNLASAATSAAAGSSLVAAYAFDEGSGTLVHDSSGNGNDGTLSNASWAGGRFGGALAFNGSSSRVTVPDSASLHLSSGMTLEAWVDPAAVTKAWSDVIYKGNDNYYVAASSYTNTMPAGAGIMAGSQGVVYGTAILPVSSWTHLALTYDGTTLRLYVNGVQVSSLAKTGGLTSSSNPLTLGSDPIYGQYFQGAIDDVRIYNAARTAAQVQTDMSTPVGGISADTTAPTAPTGLGESAATTSSISAAWTGSTDNVGVTGYRVSVDGVVTGTTTSTSYTISGLACGTSHQVVVDAYDAAGNHSQPAAATMADSTCAPPPPPDTQPPSTPTGLAVGGIGQTSVTLSWVASTDNVGVTGYRLYQGAGQVGTAVGGSYTYSGLACGTSYTLGAAAVDAAGNLSVTATVGAATAACSSGGGSANVYIAQNAAGLGDGSSCANARPATFFNTVSNWGSGKPIAPGTVVGLCGTISSTLTAQGSGTSGSPVTILFTADAKISQAVCGPCLSLSNHDYLTVDGGTNGIVESTANGTNLANHTNSTGIVAQSCNNCEVKNLSVRNMYVMSGSDAWTTWDNAGARCLFFSGANWKIHDNVFHDASWCVYEYGNGTDSNTHIYNNDIYNIDHAYIITGTGPFGKIYFNGNHIHDMGLWDGCNGGGNKCHHDGIHCFFGSTPQTFAGTYIYNNRWDGTVGGAPTAYIYIESNAGSVCSTPAAQWYVFNNIFAPSDRTTTNALVQINTGHSYLYSNTLSGPTPNDNNRGGCAVYSDAFEDNAVGGCNTFVSGSMGMPVDFNAYAFQGTSSNCWTAGGPSTCDFALYRSRTGMDSHSVFSPTGAVGSNGTGVGANLSSLCAGDLAPLCSDINGLPRPMTGPWNAGALR